MRESTRTIRSMGLVCSTGLTVGSIEGSGQTESNMERVNTSRSEDQYVKAFGRTV